MLVGTGTILRVLELVVAEVVPVAQWLEVLSYPGPVRSEVVASHMSHHLYRISAHYSGVSPTA